MYEFTKAEIERINQLYGNDFQDITPDDALLIGRFEANKALSDGEYQAHIKAINSESELRCSQMMEQHEKAMANLNTLHDEAVKRLERVENGK